MKKVYEKPEVYMERFELAEHIAGCNLTYNEDGSASGTIDGLPVENVFLPGNVVCKIEIEAYCYTAGSIGYATITS